MKKSKTVLALEAKIQELETALEVAKAEIASLQKSKAPRAERKPAAPKASERQLRAELVLKLATERGLLAIQSGLNTWKIDGDRPCTLDFWQNRETWELKGENVAGASAQEPEALFNLLSDPLPAEEPALVEVATETYLNDRL